MAGQQEGAGWRGIDRRTGRSPIDTLFTRPGVKEAANAFRNQAAGLPGTPLVSGLTADGIAVCVTSGGTRQPAEIGYYQVLSRVLTGLAPSSLTRLSAGETEIDALGRLALPSRIIVGKYKSIISKLSARQISQLDPHDRELYLLLSKVGQISLTRSPIQGSLLGGQYVFYDFPKDL